MASQGSHGGLSGVSRGSEGGLEECALLLAP